MAYVGAGRFDGYFQKNLNLWDIAAGIIIVNEAGGKTNDINYSSNKIISELVKFKKNKWKHGEFRTIRGRVIEKGGVTFSNVKGNFSKDFAKKLSNFSS